jgi:ubiquinone/menaquinone biosynthesis C-methylase UbiE
MPTGNYDKVAPYYDFLSRLVYGNAINHAHAFLVSFIPPGSSVLIVGGGTGQILTEIVKKHSSGLRIVFVDNSAKMIALAKRKFVGSNLVTFITDTIQNVILQQSFDVAITPFLFDNFSSITASSVFSKINRLVKPQGLVLFADFVANNFWQKSLLRIMYSFFRFTSNIEARQLPDTALLFKLSSYTIQTQQAFFRNFIVAIVYKRNT